MHTVRYARADGFHIAYQVVGSGPVDLLFVPSWFSHLEVLWESPMVARFLERLASFSRLILFDRRGSGLSDSCPPGALGLDGRTSDALAVLDAVGSERTALFGGFRGSSLVVQLAAQAPERVMSLALYNPVGCGFGERDIGASLPDDQRTGVVGWGSSNFGLAPTISPRHAEWWQRYQRNSLGPGDAAASGTIIGLDDVSSVLGDVEAPSLVVSNARAPFAFPDQARDLASRIRGGRFLEIHSDDVGWLLHPDDPVLDEIQEFLIGDRAAREPDRRFGVVVFTDLIGSTAMTTSVGDTEWRDAIETHDQVLAALVERHGGTVVKGTGDGALFVFEHPSSAIRCGCALADEAQRLGFHLRVGIHAGEIDWRGDDVAGLSVVIAERTMQLAPSNQVTVTGTVRDLVLGSSFGFEDHGHHDLKGVPGPWQIWRVHCANDAQPR